MDISNVPFILNPNPFGPSVSTQNGCSWRVPGPSGLLSSTSAVSQSHTGSRLQPSVLGNSQYRPFPGPGSSIGPQRQSNYTSNQQRPDMHKKPLNAPLPYANMGLFTVPPPDFSVPPPSIPASKVPKVEPVSEVAPTDNREEVERLRNECTSINTSRLALLNQVKKLKKELQASKNEKKGLIERTEKISESLTFWQQRSIKDMNEKQKLQKKLVELYTLTNRANEQKEELMTECEDLRRKFMEERTRAAEAKKKLSQWLHSAAAVPFSRECSPDLCIVESGEEKSDGECTEEEDEMEEPTLKKSRTIC